MHSMHVANEVRLVGKLEHPYLIAPISSHVGALSTELTMEYAPNGTLHSRLHEDFALEHPFSSSSPPPWGAGQPGKQVSQQAASQQAVPGDRGHPGLQPGGQQHWHVLSGDQPRREYQHPEHRHRHPEATLEAAFARSFEDGLSLRAPSARLTTVASPNCIASTGV